MKLSITTAFLLATGAQAFTTMPKTKSQTSLNMLPKDAGKIAAASCAAALLTANIAFADAAFAMDDMDFGSSQIVAARSGGRAGGRSSARSAPRSAPRAASNTVIQRTTVVRPSPVIVAPPVYGGYGYGYNPVPGLGK